MNPLIGLSVIAVLVLFWITVQEWLVLRLASCVQDDAVVDSVYGGLTFEQYEAIRMVVEEDR